MTSLLEQNTGEIPLPHAFMRPKHGENPAPFRANHSAVATKSCDCLFLWSVLFGPKSGSALRIETIFHRECPLSHEESLRRVWPPLSLDCSNTCVEFRFFSNILSQKWVELSKPLLNILGCFNQMGWAPQSPYGIPRVFQPNEGCFNQMSWTLNSVAAECSPFMLAE